MKHNVDFNVLVFENIDKLNREVDSLKLGALANLEELHQLLTKNAALADSKGWQTQNMMTHLESIIEILRKQI